MITGTGFPDRDAVIDYIRRQLIGPVQGAHERLSERPSGRYLSGMLYPRPDELKTDGPFPAIEEDTAEELDDQPHQLLEADDEDPIILAGQTRPASVGISFVTSGWSPIEVDVSAARYLEEDGEWRREELKLNTGNAIAPAPQSNRLYVQNKSLWDGTASLRVTWRPHGEGALVTVVLVNENIQQERRRVVDSDCFFQVELTCQPTAGHITRYPTLTHPHTDDEAKELELLYRNVSVFAIGHGSAAEWDRQNDLPSWVRTSFLPVHVVPDVAFDLEGVDTILHLNRLAEIDNDPQESLAGLEEFVNLYADWICRTWDSVAGAVAPDLCGAAEDLHGRATTACERMRSGIELLRTNQDAREAFGLANRVMAMQMAHSEPGLAGSSHPFAEAPDPHVDYTTRDPRWRPFQLGFLLLTIKSVVEEDDRDLVDLIWFPTGGGKTEAYLGLAAFTILHRRLTLGDRGAGTTVITRYTLRLLTAQQFQRAATMIAACEILRRERHDELGSRPISIGIWVGSSNSPNKFADARILLAKLQKGEEAEEGFQIEICPWCGTKIIPTERDDADVWGIFANNNSFHVRCVNDRCPFASELPISSVDDDLYQNPPTMLVGTVDKFARAAWNPRTGVFFGALDDQGPSLIIQDEFHLISGPLGTIVGLYEAAFDVLMEHHKLRPKIVAATATIRRADEQTRGVFGRDVALFPPAGIDAADSYFVRTNRESNGRAYVGVMPQGHTPLTGLIHLTAAQLQAPLELALAAAPEDGYSTLVVYHNSLRELGKTITLAKDDVPSRIKVIAAAEDQCRVLNEDNVVELTSNVSSRDIPRTLRRLALRHDDSNGVAFLASTNMISVGVDVSRLGVMTVVGQPKTTAEYIQATSRVGRDAKCPGLVLTLYSPSKPRDRSHYESFVPYHETLYRSVEPSSVTPFSVPARIRALHADLVILVRHALGLPDEDDAARFDPDDALFQELITKFLARVERADSTESGRVSAHLTDLVHTWVRRIDNAEEQGGLRYGLGGGRERPKLMRRYPERGEGWPTLDSMRSVDIEVPVHVTGGQR
ncbi:helicase-related protein [Lentzea albida]|uniref:Helicase conserved C-terminal domain-containing protein n=1 Tax=Lentzea albida TaxID=65499 RepID=A0A1H9BQV1_9PSEU|nr:helicase-related protein [Lentzea albida]SEP91279.1 Helicase conserved C-terminal domain-containing protein [Lentzea albida]